MLMKNDKKGMAAIILSKLGKKDESAAPAPMSEDGSAQQDDSIAVDTAGEELIAAIKSGSAKGVVEAIKSIMELAESSEPEAEEASEPEQA